MLYIVSCLVILPLFVVFLKQIVAISTLRNSLITSFSLLTNLAAYFIDCIRRNTTATPISTTTFRWHSWYLKPFSNEWKSLSLSLSHMKPLKNDSNINKERRESTTIYFTSIRQSNECVGGVEWTDWCCSMRSLEKRKRSSLSWLFFLFVLASDRSLNLLFTRARVVVRGI